MALWRSSVRSRSAPPSSFKLLQYMLLRKSILPEITLTFFFFIGLGCSQETMQEEATKILSAEDNVSGSYIEKSIDGLQFSKKSEGTDTDSTVGFSKEGELTYKGNLKRGQPHGLWTTYFSDGKPLWEGYKREGVNHGTFTMWYENGRKRIEGSYENGLKHGRSIAWHQNGVKWQQKSYHLGNPVGKWKTWDKKGILTSEVSHGEISERNTSSLIND